MMKTLKSTRQIPKAQQEVWDCKQALYEEIKDMSMADGLNYLLEKGQKATIRHKKTLSSYPS
jgi:translation elongation factor EF-Ts